LFRGPVKKKKRKTNRWALKGERRGLELITQGRKGLLLCEKNTSTWGLGGRNKESRRTRVIKLALLKPGLSAKGRGPPIKGDLKKPSTR